MAVEYVAGKSEAEFLADVLCQDAVIRRLEVIGEAAGRVSEVTRAKLSILPWTAMIVWTSVQDSLPKLIDVLKTYLGNDS